jgi:molecular chaperone DnaK (HSP70)
MTLIIGIDLGTSNCCISYINDKGEIEIIFNETNYLIPSIVSIEKEGILVGNEVNKLHINNNKNIFHNFKRLIGHNISDIEITNLKNILNYNIIEENEQIKCVDTDNKKYNLEEIIYYLLNKIKQIIEENINVEWKCIITIPAYFNEIQRQITMNAINLTKLPCIKLLNEPTAASFAYLYNNKVLYEQTFDKKILVIDFGAGTLDLTILDINKEDEVLCEVLGIYGDNNFGGIDITKIINDNIFNEFDNMDINSKLQIAEDIKIKLSNEIDVKYYSSILEKEYEYKYDKYIEELKNISNRMLNPIKNILDIAKIKKEEIDEIILVGGSFKIPYFRELISTYFNLSLIHISEPTRQP